MNRTRTLKTVKVLTKVAFLAVIILAVMYSVGKYIVSTLHSANWGEYSYTAVATLGLVCTIVVIGKSWGDWWFARTEENRHPGTNKGEVIVTTWDLTRFILSLIGLGGIVYIGTRAMFTPPANVQTPVTQLSIEFAIVLLILDVVLAIKPITSLIERAQLDAANREEAEAEKQAEVVAQQTRIAADQTDRDSTDNFNRNWDRRVAEDDAQAQTDNSIVNVHVVNDVVPVSMVEKAQVTDEQEGQE